jgi:hypothetical protein
MPTVRVRYTATDEAFSAMLHAFESIKGIEHIEEVADLVPHMDDEDSSSAGLPVPLYGPVPPRKCGPRGARARRDLASAGRASLVAWVDRG